MTYPIKSPRKLIEVALPLDSINEASVRESFIYRGNPSSLHKWWAQRPLAAARAVLFAQLVNDPGYQQGNGFKYGMNKSDAAVERKRLFDIIEELVKWESTNDEDVLARAHAEIRRSWREVCELNRDHPRADELFNADILPTLCDPFAGGGSIPLEAQRLGLKTLASDLNPVAVLINKAVIEIPTKFAGLAPVNPESRKPENTLGRIWMGAGGTAEDVRYYSAWIRNEAQKRIGHLYQQLEITADMARERPDIRPLVGQNLTVLAWLWARTVKSPNPAFSHVDVPLASTFMLSSKAGKEAYVEPSIEHDSYHFKVKLGKPSNTESTLNGTKLGRGASFKCLMSGTPIESEYIYREANAGRMGTRLMAVVVEGNRRRVYLPSTEPLELLAREAKPDWKPDLQMPDNPRWFSPPLYGLKTYGDIFTSRQLLALATFSELIADVQKLVCADAAAAGLADDSVGLSAGGTGATAYGQTLVLYLAFALSKMTDYNCSLVPWYTKEDRPGHLFSKQAIPMVWDFAEINPLSEIGGTFLASADIVANALSGCAPNRLPGDVTQTDATNISLAAPSIFSTDPPYYDNIGYADLSDFFYIWLRRVLKPVFPELFSTIAVPKAKELVATPYRHGGKEKAEAFFLTGMTQALQRIADQAHPAFPITIYYAFKQSESIGKDNVSSTGWETFLDAVIRSGLAIRGTWPIRTERGARSVGIGTNALASSIILVCCKRTKDAATISRREFLRDLNIALPEALDEMTKGAGGDRSPVAPVDLSQAIIGPGMAVFSKYSAVLEADGTPMSVRTALQLINRFLAEDDFDADTQFCLHWFNQYGWKTGPFGEADVLARAKGTSVSGVQAAGVVEAGGGSVRLRKWTEYPSDWNPQGDTRNPVWETLHQLIRALKNEGETNAGALLAAVRGKSEATRQLAYRLYTLCERAGWAEDARAYNELITSWDGIEAAASSAPTTSLQSGLFD